MNAPPVQSENLSSVETKSLSIDFPTISACVDRLSNIIKKQVARALLDEGINYSHWRVMRAIKFENVNTPAQLAKVIYVETAAITHCLDRLESLHLISREKGKSDDRRITKIQLTAEGNRITLKGLKCIDEVLGEICNNLDSKPAQALVFLYQQSLKLS